MPDRKKVIKGLGMCAGTNEDAWETHSTCDLDCPYAGKGCVDNLMADALALLKEQEPVKPFFDEYMNPRCGKCHRRLFCVDDKDSFCSKCGQAVKWDG